MHGCWLARLLLPMAAAASLLAFAPAASAVRKQPCVPGQKKPKCFVVPAKVGPVGDGDTFQAKIGGSKKFQLVRVTGIQAMELHVYGRRRGREGECNAVEATVALEKMIRGEKVRLLSQQKNATTEGERGRLRRSVQVKIGGRWVDPAYELLKQGLVLWFPNGQEWAWNRKYSKMAAEMAAQGIGVWNPDSCGAGPGEGIPLSMKLKWDAEGSDAKNINGEWARISNLDPVRPLDLHRWWFRDSHLRPRLTFPSGAVIPPNESIKVHAGRGQNDEDSFYWGLTESAWENVSGGRKGMGDGGYLFDPQGDVRSFVQFPCQVGCREPAKGRVSIHATFRGMEYVTLRNISSTPLDLTYYEIESVPWFSEFKRGTILRPNQRMVLYIGNGPASRRGDLTANWGFKSGLLADRRDVVTLRNPYGAPVICHAWGKQEGKPLECPRV